MSLTIDPPACTVPAAGGKSTHALNNGTAAKIIIKVKCSNNTEYRMNPVYSFVDAGAKIDLEVTRLAGPAKEDKAVIQWGPAPADATDPQAGFPGIPPDQIQSVTLPLSATAEGAAPAAPAPDAAAAPADAAAAPPADAAAAAPAEPAPS